MKFHLSKPNGNSVKGPDRKTQRSKGISTRPFPNGGLFPPISEPPKDLPFVPLDDNHDQPDMRIPLRIEIPEAPAIRPQDEPEEERVVIINLSPGNEGWIIPCIKVPNITEDIPEIPLWIIKNPSRDQPDRRPGLYVPEREPLPKRDQ